MPIMTGLNAPPKTPIFCLSAIIFRSVVFSVRVFSFFFSLALSFALDFYLLFSCCLRITGTSFFLFLCDTLLVRLTVKNYNSADYLNNLSAKRLRKLLRKFLRGFGCRFKVNSYFNKFSVIKRIVNLSK